MSLPGVVCPLGISIVAFLSPKSLTTNVNRRAESSPLSCPSGRFFWDGEGISLPLLLSPLVVSKVPASLTSQDKQYTLIWTLSAVLRWGADLSVLPAQCAGLSAGNLPKFIGQDLPYKSSCRPWKTVGVSRCALAKACCRCSSCFLPHPISFESPRTWHLAKPYLKNNLMSPFSWLSVARPVVLLGASQGAWLLPIIKKHWWVVERRSFGEKAVWGLNSHFALGDDGAVF